jgi:hypothetical protein
MFTIERAEEALATVKNLLAEYEKNRLPKSAKYYDHQITGVLYEISVEVSENLDWYDMGYGEGA